MTGWRGQAARPTASVEESQSVMSPSIIIRKGYRAYCMVWKHRYEEHGR